MITIFWLTSLMILYIFIGYPLMLILLGKIKNCKIHQGEAILPVNIVIPVHNGEREIGDKIENCLHLDYPQDMLDIYVVSDASTDASNEIVKSYPGVHLLELTERSGKVGAQNQVFPLLKNEITVFTDVSIKVPSDALRNTVRNFTDPSIGVVSCRDRIIGEKEQNAESLYIKYDMTVRRFLNKAGTLIGVTGGYFAIRTHMLDQPWKPEIAPDFYAALLAVKNGFRAIEDSDIIAEYKVTKNTSDEYTRKVRTITRGMSTLFDNKRLLNPFLHPQVSWQLLSHKLLRWLLPVFLLSILASNIMIVTDRPDSTWFYSLTLLAQIIFWLASWYGLIRKQSQSFVFRTTASFLLFNVALLKSWSNYFVGNKISIWNPTVRT
jgi:cellulose synthase/poly-beta-1,6-N-acetylglucosamine synthase-like glycosyltransferase